MLGWFSKINEATACWLVRAFPRAWRERFCQTAFRAGPRRKRWLQKRLQLLRKPNGHPPKGWPQVIECKWCGEGDLNPHEITPASTSS
jgi:hypothetical protein